MSAIQEVGFYEHLFWIGYLPSTVLIYLQAVDDDGEHEVIGKVYKKGTKSVIKTVKVHTKGGRGDSMESQLIERLENSGEKFGDELVDDVLDNLYD